MSYTSFRFPSLSERAIIKVNDAPAVAGIWYEKENVITAEKADNNHYGEPYDEITYETKNDKLLSNVATIKINFPPDKSLEPLSENTTITSSNNTIIDLENHILYNNAVDRIKIISFTSNIGELEFIDSLISPEKIIMQYELNQLTFNTLTGNGSPFQKINYKVGNVNGYSTDTYSITINIDGKASLLSLSEDENEVEENGVGYKYIESYLKIENGYIDSTAKIEMNVNLSENTWPTSTQNQITIGDEIINENGVFPVDIPLNVTGESEIFFSLAVDLEDVPVTGDITIRLIDIDGDTNLVSETNTQTINVNF